MNNLYEQFSGRNRFFILAALLLLLYLSFFTVSETEYVLVTQFGDPVSEHKTAGLKFKWPFQSITRLDKRLHLYNPRPSEYLTRDKKNLLIENYVMWKIEDPLLFIQTVGDTSGAEMRLHDIVWSQVSAAVGQTELSELVSTDPDRIRTGALMNVVTEECRKLARSRYGVDIATVDIKRINLPAQNRESVF
ncbi:protease modulator HflC, partial [Acidobacteria bacterium AH-259-O06]|nr:protease modulator HflC [Acidobacteria bacterium AH-259-O06]